MADTSKPQEKPAEDGKSTAEKTTYHYPEVGGTSFSVQAESQEEADKLADKIRKEKDNG